MFDVGFSEILVILLVVLLLFGPDKLPELAKKIGKFMGEARRHSDILRREFYNSVYNPAEDFKRQLDLGARELRATKEESLKAVLEPQNQGNETPQPDPNASDRKSVEQGKDDA